MKEFSLRIEYDGKPPGEQRARTSKGRFHVSPKTVNDRKKIAIMAKAAGVEMIEKDVPVAVEIVAYFPMPKNFSQKKRIAAMTNRIFPTVKPDIDNIEVLVLNSLNRIAFWDDAQVVEVKKKKIYAHQGKLFITISEVENE